MMFIILTIIAIYNYIFCYSIIYIMEWKTFRNIGQCTEQNKQNIDISNYYTCFGIKSFGYDIGWTS